jgi:hypothetical protein
MIDPTLAFTKFSLAVIGSGWLCTASQLGLDSNASILGGWALAVTGLVTFWKQSQRDRKEFREQQKEERQSFQAQLKDERKRSDKYHEEVSTMGKQFEKLTYSITELISKFTAPSP